MTKLFIAQVRDAGGERPLVTIRAEAEGEARLFLAAAYPDAEIAHVAEPGDWTSDADTGSRAKARSAGPTNMAATRIAENRTFADNWSDVIHAPSGLRTEGAV
jgi:hypothetical protein